MGTKLTDKELLDELIEAAMHILHHDACDGGKETAWERHELRKAFSALLAKRIKKGWPSEEDRP